MPFHPSPHSPASLALSLAGVLAAAGILAAVTGCSHLTPLGPVPVQPRLLGSPIVLEAIRLQPPTSPGRCPADWAPFSAPGQQGNTCYRRLGVPVRLTSAAISTIISRQPSGPAGPQAGPSSYGFEIGVPPADVAAVTALVKQAFDAQGAVDISVAGKTWAAPEVLSPFPGRQLQIFLPSRSEALQLRRILVPPS